MSDRKLTIAVKADTKEGEKLKKFFSDLTTEGNRAAKAFSNISLNVLGKEGQKGAVAKTILESKGLLSDLGEHGKKLGKIFEGDVAKGAAVMGEKLKAVNDRIKTLTDSYEKWVKLSKDANAAGKDDTMFRQAADNMKSQLQDALMDKKGIQKGMGAFGSSKYGGLLSDIKDLMGNTSLGRVMQAGAPVGIGMALAALVSQANRQMVHGDMFQSTFGLQQQAIVGQTTGALAARRSMGDMRERIWDHGINDAKVDYAGRSAVRNVELERTRSGKLANMRYIDYGLSFVPGTTSYYESQEENVDKARDAASAQARLAAREAMIAASPKKAMQIDAFLNESGRARMNAFRWGGSTTQAMTAINQDAATYNIPAEMSESIRHQLVSSAGRGGLGYKGAVISKVLGGMNPGAAASIAAGGMGSGNNTLAAVSGRGLDPTAVQEMLGSAINNYIGPGSIISRRGYEADAIGDALASGLYGQNSAAQMRMLQQNVGGLGRLDALTSGGGDSWQKTVNLSNAIQNYGPGKSIYGANALANVSFADLVKFKDVKDAKDLPNSMKAFDITPETLRKQYGAFTQSLFSRFADNTNDQTSGAQILRKVRDGGGDFKKWGKTASRDEKEQLAAYLNQVGGGAGGLFGGVTDTEGMIRILTGGGEPGNRGRRGAGGAGGDPADEIQRQQRMFYLDSLKEVTTGLKSTAAAAQSATGAYELQTRAVEKLTAAELLYLQTIQGKGMGLVPPPQTPARATSTPSTAGRAPESWERWGR